MQRGVKTNSLRAWLLASRPKTLTGAIAPVAIALGTAYALRGSIDWIPGGLCLLFALLMQVDSNLVNDYFDCVGGIDSAERIGPARACSEGWITLPAMRYGIGVVTAVACLAGLPLVAWGGWECVLVGVCCTAFCFLYTMLFSRIALGDVLVVLFFGLIPVCYTCYFQLQDSDSVFQLPKGVWVLALSIGLQTDSLLLVNNFRDRHTDAAVGKRTLATLLGERCTLLLYATVGCVAVGLACIGIAWIKGEWCITSALPCLMLPLHIWLSIQMKRIYKGAALNTLLGQTALSILLFSLLTTLSLVM